MKEENYSSTITVNEAPQKIMESICHVAAWWATNVKGNSKNPGEVFTVRFGKTYSNIKITELVPLKKITWLILDSYLPLFKKVDQWNNTEIVWEIFADEISSRLTMTHIGLTPSVECYIDCRKGWNFYIKESLYKLITEDTGFPGSGIFAHISGNNKKYTGILYSKTDTLPDLPGEYILIDVKQTEGEHVTAMHSVQKLNKLRFDAQRLNGEYYMLIKDEPLYNDATPLQDILKMFDN